MSRGFERVALEALVFRPNRADESLRKVDLPALQHRQLFGTDGVDQLHLHVWDSVARSGAGNPERCRR